jgi:hypothetical protein
MIGISLAASAGAQPIENPANGHYYELVYHEDERSWEQAEAEAAGRTFNGWRGHLATITSAEEADFLLASFPEMVRGATIFLGGSDEGSEGSWYWITGEPWTYENWDLGAPDGLGSENCLETFGIPGYSTTLWNDIRCDSTARRWIVEYGPQETIAAGKWEHCSATRYLPEKSKRHPKKADVVLVVSPAMVKAGAATPGVRYRIEDKRGIHREMLGGSVATTLELVRRGRTLEKIEFSLEVDDFEAQAFACGALPEPLEAGDLLFFGFEYRERPRLHRYGFTTMGLLSAVDLAHQVDCVDFEGR